MTQNPISAPVPTVRASEGLRNVRYEIRGKLARRAQEMERLGYEIISLNIGNPGAFGFRTPEILRLAMIENLSRSEGYSHQKGIFPAREAIVLHQQARGVQGVTVDDVFIGNGVSELIDLTLRGLLNDGDEVLVPSPDYPLWTGAINLCGGRAVHYRCDEQADWEPDLEHVASRITARTKALVIINPNNPTGAVYSRQTLLGLLDLARTHGLLVLTDEIYDQILYGGAVHWSAAALAPDLLVLTLGGLSKTYRLAGFRSGWLVISGPREHAADYLDGLELLANMRLCPNVPAQHAIEPALGGRVDITHLLEPGGRLRDQRDHAWERMTAIPGVSCYQPAGALYLFARLDPEVYPIHDDEQMMIDLLDQQHVLLSHGSGFNLPTTDHLRLVFLASVPVLDDAIGRLAAFLASYHQ
jgi:alanine-synthesizing transaminase